LRHHALLLLVRWWMVKERRKALAPLYVERQRL